MMYNSQLITGNYIKLLTKYTSPLSMRIDTSINVIYTFNALLFSVTSSEGLMMLHYTIKQSLKMARVVGLHPYMRGSKWQLMIHAALMAANWICFFMVLYYLSLREGKLTIAEFAHSFSGISLIMHGIQRSTCFFFRRKNVSELLDDIQTKFWREADMDISDEEKASFKKYYRRLKFSFFCFASMCTANTAILFLQPVILEGNLLPMDCYRPSWVPFYPYWIFQGMVLSLGIHWPAVSLDTLIMTVIVLTHIQFQLLNRETKHVFILLLSRYIDTINKTFSETLLCYLWISVVALCVEMYNFSAGADPELFIRAGVYLSANLFQFVAFYCIPAQKLTDEASKMGNSAYFSYWYEYMSCSCTTQLVIMQSQKKAIVTAGGLIDINLATCLTTVKTMVSYCMFLRTMGAD
nr:unnamed protein product [Callosobruchus chinensis]